MILSRKLLTPSKMNKKILDNVRYWEALQELRMQKDELKERLFIAVEEQRTRDRIDALRFSIQRYDNRF